MPRKHDRKPEQISGDLSDPLGMGTLLSAFLSGLRVRNYAEGTIHKHRVQLNKFIEWSADRSLTRPSEITRPILQRYQRHLYEKTNKQGKRLSFRNQHARLLSIRAWFRWLARNNHILHNPASELELPKLGHRFPKHVLSQAEADRVMNVADPSDPLGVRDRAMLETFYSTGMRRLELIGLQLYDVDADRGVATIRQGKGKKDRVVPVGKRALAWIDKYVREVRPALCADANEQSLFLTRLGEPFSPSSVSLLVRDYVDRAEIGKSGSCHLFRHTMATLMLENGADIRYIQAMLGHAKLDTTQIYTQVSIRKLKEIHEATHPAKHKRQQQDDAEQPDENETNSDDTDAA